MSCFAVGDTPLSGLKVITRCRVGDARGFLSRLFCGAELAEVGWTAPIAQINQTYTALPGTVRGMHFQRPPHAEKKLVICLQGEVFDVAVDLRRGSATFLKSHAEVLTAENGNALLIPEGYAHGFQALTPDVSVLYLHSTPYEAAAEGGLNPNDPSLNITWPLSIAHLSDRDRDHPLIDRTFQGLLL